LVKSLLLPTYVFLWNSFEKDIVVEPEAWNLVSVEVKWTKQSEVERGEEVKCSIGKEEGRVFTGKVYRSSKW